MLLMLTARPMGRTISRGRVNTSLPGWDETYRYLRRFAHHGYAAISHNLYDRIGYGPSDDVAARHEQRRRFR